MFKYSALYYYFHCSDKSHVVKNNVVKIILQIYDSFFMIRYEQGDVMLIFGIYLLQIVSAPLFQFIPLIIKLILILFL